MDFVEVKVDDPEVQQAVAQLRSLGLIKAISTRRRLPRRWTGESLAFWVLRAADAGFAFELEGPADTVPAGNFWVFDIRFLTDLLKRMQALAPDFFRPTAIVDRRIDIENQPDGHRLSFVLNERTHELTLEEEWLQNNDCHACLAKLFDFVNQALFETKAPCVFLCFEGNRRKHANCEYRVVAASSSSVRDIRQVIPICFGPSANRTGQGAFEAKEIRRPVDIVGADRIFVEDAESVDEAAAYVPLVEEIARLAGKDLAISNIRCTEGESRGEWLVFWTTSGVDYSTKLPANGWVAVAPLVAELNRSLPQTVTDRFFEFREPEWGQEFGILYASPSQAEQLRASGFLVDATAPPSS